jgi:transmembrane sensor
MAADLSHRIEHAAAKLSVAWSEDRAANILAGVARRRRRQQTWRAAAAGAAVLGLLLLSPRLIALLTHGNAPRLAIAPKAPTAAPVREAARAELLPLRLRDGSLARPQSRTSQLHVREDGPGRTVVAMAGAARFDVVHDPQRLFRVETSGLAVEVLGTQFVVEEQGPAVRVAVQEGRVRVRWASHYDELSAGQSALFPRQPIDAAAPPPASLPPLNEPPPSAARAPIESSVPARPPSRRSVPHSEHAPPAVAAEPPAATAPAPSSEPSSWQALAHEGQFEQAYRLTYGPPADAAGPHPEPPLLREREVSPGDLLLLADVARLSHHAADAVAPLSRVLREHAGDPRAPLAAFTLGRVLLDDLGRPREAAQSFARAQQLDPDGPLSQDALAREVEAWSRAGENQSARARALQYVQKYPAGRRLRSVRHFGELL